MSAIWSCRGEICDRGSTKKSGRKQQGKAAGPLSFPDRRLGTGLRLHGRLGRIRHAGDGFPSGGRPGGHDFIHADRHGDHAGDRKELFLSDGAQLHDRRRIYLYQGSVRPGSRLPELLVPVPLLSDDCVSQRHGVVFYRAHAVCRCGAYRFPLYGSGKYDRPGRDAGFRASPGGCGGAFYRCKAAAAAHSHRSGDGAVCGRARYGGLLSAACGFRRRVEGFWYSRPEQGLCGAEPDRDGALGLCGL